MAGGTYPLSYQWFFNGSIVQGATGASLNLTNIQRSQAGVYTVLLTNIYGSATSSPAVLVVDFRPANVSLPVTTAVSGGDVSVPLTLAANGNENVLTFSLLFDPELLIYSNTLLAQGATGVSLLVDSS